MMFGRGYNNVYSCFGGHGNFGNFGGFISPFHIGFAIIITLLIIFAIYKLTKKKDNQSDEVLEILKMKYVSGEIDEEEYVKRKNVLKK